MTGNVTSIKQDTPLRPPRFVETPSANAMLLALRRARARERLTMIAGAPGVGKSEAMWAFKREVPSAIVVTAVCQEGGTWNLANKLCKVLDLGEPNSRRMPETRIKIAEEIGQGGFLMIDEAQHLVQENPRGQKQLGSFGMGAWHGRRGLLWFGSDW